MLSSARQTPAKPATQNNAKKRNIIVRFLMAKGEREFTIPYDTRFLTLYNPAKSMACVSIPDGTIAL